jgi:uncharacterized alkaline shock family protein YloU
VTEPLAFRGPEGSITVTAGALTRLIAHAAKEVEGVRVRRPKRAVEVTWDTGRASVSLRLLARYGEPLPALAHAVQERVAAAVAGVSGAEVDRVDVEIAEIA